MKTWTTWVAYVMLSWTLIHLPMEKSAAMATIEAGRKCVAIDANLNKHDQNIWYSIKVYANNFDDIIVSFIDFL